MKKIVLGGVFAIAALGSISANAALICSGGIAGAGASVASVATGFVKTTFRPKCSANVLLRGVDVSSTLYGVSSGSAKGRKVFVGSSAGGAVCSLPAAADCPVTGCTTTQVSDLRATTEANNQALPTPTTQCL
jgi:hypothetical protein